MILQRIIGWRVFNFSVRDILASRVQKDTIDQDDFYIYAAVSAVHLSHSASDMDLAKEKRYSFRLRGGGRDSHLLKVDIYLQVLGIIYSASA